MSFVRLKLLPWQCLGEGCFYFGEQSKASYHPIPPMLNIMACGITTHIKQTTHKSSKSDQIESMYIPCYLLYRDVFIRFSVKYKML